MPNTVSIMSEKVEVAEEHEYRLADWTGDVTLSTRGDKGDCTFLRRLTSFSV